MCLGNPLDLEQELEQYERSAEDDDKLMKKDYAIVNYQLWVVGDFVYVDKGGSSHCFSGNP